MNTYDITSSNFLDLFNLLKIQSFDSPSLCELIYHEINSQVRNQIVPEFWSQFRKPPEPYEIQNYVIRICTGEDNAMQLELFKDFATAVASIHKKFKSLKELLKRLQLLAGADMTNFQEKKFNDFMRHSLLAQLPPHFRHCVNSFYCVSLRVFANVHRGEANGFDFEMGPEGASCAICEIDTSPCHCTNLNVIATDVNEKLLELELLDRLAGETITSLVQELMKEHVKNHCHGIFDRSHLQDLMAWLYHAPITWLTQTFVTDPEQIILDAPDSPTIKVFQTKLTYYLYEIYAKSLIDQFFIIIIDFPDSIPVINDLKVCMQKIDIRQQLIETLKSSLEKRILHPGVNTRDIITGYIAAIKAIRHLDSSGVILETVTAPVKEYLRKRSDTVRRVVTGLIEDGPSDLSEELAKSDAIKITPSVSAELSDWENWVPDPTGYGIKKMNQSMTTTPSSRTADIISMMVDIYGSKELFINEYRNLMADRLLSQLDFSMEKEVRNLELLKLRFGESVLHNCEVMLKDMSDSKRINAHIQSDANYNDEKEIDISSLIISSQFWPSFNKESLELPPELENEFKKYTKSYEAYKGNRTLNWRHVTGRVQIELELGERTIELTVSPTQAVIIYHFQDKNVWSLEDLSAVMKVPATILRRRIAFWQTNGLLKEEETDIFRLNEDEECNQVDQMTINELSSDDVVESAMASANDQREEELQVFWSYIVGMLTNLDSLPLDRIHQMLKLFASQGVGAEFTQEELKDFLQRKVREHKLLFSGGVYQLAK